MQRRFWAGAARPFGFPSLNVLRLPSKRLRNRHLTWGHDASKSSFERTSLAAGHEPSWCAVDSHTGLFGRAAAEVWH